MMNTPRKSLIAASTILALGALGMGSAIANSAHSPDPYVYPSASAIDAVGEIGASTAAPALTQVQVGVYDNHGKLVGFEWVANRR
jgi:hypothetical protein